MSESTDFPDASAIRDMFDGACGELDIEPSQEDIESLVIYEMTDGTRTSMEDTGAEAYYNGGIFCLRIMHFLKSIGARHLYLNVIHERHKDRVNYQDIYEGFTMLVDQYRDFALEHDDVKWTFVGDFKQSIAPADADQPFDIRAALDEFEKLTRDREDALSVYFMINYSTQWLTDEGWSLFKDLPNANVILRHCKGYVNGDMWLPTKLDNNTFMYAQNGSVSNNWTDRQLVYLIAIALRSMLLNRGTHYSKKYAGDEQDHIRRQREEQLSLVHRQLDEAAKPKRAIIFSPVGPEIYEF
ncbi:MAG: hypothetical protein KGY55_03945 [Candidatus Thermoplasmatota archaeon]|nr:hypothetical protein [Candidatus Thermoplasmatota archaeon]